MGSRPEGGRRGGHGVGGVWRARLGADAGRARGDVRAGPVRRGGHATDPDGARGGRPGDGARSSGARSPPGLVATPGTAAVRRLTLVPAGAAILERPAAAEPPPRPSAD